MSGNGGRAADLAERAERRIELGLPETRHFSGAASYPLDSFIDPESEWEAYANLPDDARYDEDGDAGGMGGPPSPRSDQLDAATLARRVGRFLSAPSDFPPASVSALDAALLLRGGTAATTIRGLADRSRQRAAAGAARAGDCYICLDAFRGDDESCSLPCGHRFHTVCAVRWLVRAHTCPACRRAVDGEAG